MSELDDALRAAENHLDALYGRMNRVEIQRQVVTMIATNTALGILHHSRYCFDPHTECEIDACLTRLRHLATTGKLILRSNPVPAAPARVIPFKTATQGKKSC